MITDGWRQDAACKDTDPELFFSLSRAKGADDAAKAWCKACPVRLACLEYAIRTGSVGVWGGMTDEERRAERRRRHRRTGQRAPRVQIEDVA